MRDRQAGMTFLGVLLVMAMAGVIVYGGIRLAPVYLNYMKVAHTLQSVSTELKGQTIDQFVIRRALERHWEIESIDRITPDDVQIERGDGTIALHVDYDDRVSFIGNVSLVAHFVKTVPIQ